MEIGAPKTQIVSQTVFETEASASSAIRGIYALMMTNTSFTKGSIEEYTGIASDELINYSTSANRVQFYQNSLTAINADVRTVFWGEAYKYISNTNVILEGLQKADQIPSSARQRLIGETLFIRGFCYYYLAALFGDVPYLATSDYKLNSKEPRSSFQEVLAKIEDDLIKAIDFLPADFSFSGGERIQPNRGAATALLARIYLYQGEWEKAETAATAIISNTDTYSLLTDLNQVFSPNSAEAIWQLKPVIPNTGAPQATIFILNSAPNGISRRVSMTTQLAGAFESGDQRKMTWTKTFSNTSGSWNYFFKYRTTNAPTEYSMVFRLAEQYLIRAEARTHRGNFEGAQDDINAIRSRAGLPDTEADDTETLLNAILQERRVELFGEFGHRWLDLKRAGKSNAVLSLIKPQWQATDTLFPIPQSERLLNPDLTQNEGY